MPTQDQSHEENTGLGLNQILDMPLTVSVSKLDDADQYSADDIDGITESIFGSGNLAYASLQASQTDAAIALNDTIELGSEHVPGQNDNISFSHPTTFENPDSFNVREETALDVPTDTDRVLENGDIASTETLGAEGSFTGTTIGSLGASTMFSDAKATRASSPKFDFDQNGGADGVNGLAGPDGQNGQNGADFNFDLEEIIMDLIDDLLGDADDIITSITNTSINVTEILSSNINNVTETVNNFLEETDITEITENITNITNNITENVTDVVNNVLDDVLGGGISIDLDDGILDMLSSGLNLTVDDSIIGNIGTDLVSSTLSDLMSGLTGLNVPILPDSGFNIGFDLLNPDIDSIDGNDISIAGLSTPDISLDLVEGIVGDIDIGLELPAEPLSDPGTLIEDITGLTDNLDDIALADPDEILDVLGNQNAEGAVDIVFGDTGLSNDFDTDTDSILEDAGGLGSLTGEDSENLLGSIVDEIIDTVEAFTENIGNEKSLSDDIDNIANDLDSTVDEAMGLLDAGDIGDDLTGDLLGDNEDEAGWTESTVDAGGLFDDVVGGIGGESDSLPDPGGTVAEGLGALDIEPELDLGGLGGLLG